MRNSIAGFNKTEHFNYRQWDRQISDNLLIQILRKIEFKNSNTLLVVSRNVVRKINKNANKELFIKIDNNTLITCFYCEFQEYSASKRKQNYLLISKI
ncbi:hypothetical protein [Lacinutrix sp. MEBiC02404]